MLKLLVCLLILCHPAKAGFWGSVRNVVLSIGTAVTPDPSPANEASIRPELRLFNGSFENFAVINTFDNGNPLIKQKLQNASQITVIVHGWKESMSDRNTKSWSWPLINSLVGQPGHMVLFLDWENGAKSTLLRPYSKAAINTQTVGKWLGNKLARTFEINFNKTKTHCIGFSLGAHVCGIAGYTISKQNGQKWSRISGLEPPYQRFNAKSNVDRLDYYDADFVDIIITSQLALHDSIIGHLVIIVNKGNRKWGKIQPDCSALDFDFGKCSHGRAAALYAWSAANSEDCYYSQSMQNHVGYRATFQRGTWYVSSKEYPYCIY